MVIAAWMAYAVAMSALLLAGAWAAERAVRMYRGPTRLPWAAALLGSAAVPAAAWAAPSLLSSLSPVASSGGGGGITGAPTAAAAVALERLEVTASAAALAGLDLDLLLGAAWGLATAVLLVRLLWARRELTSALASAAHRRLGGVRVVLTPDLGPAVTGLGRGRVVLPRWLWRLGARERRLAVAHEREHLRAGDPWLLAGGRLLAAFMPWNLPLWWGLRRLRLATETDCDRRVLRAGADPRAYGDLLLSVGERSRPVRGLAALAERTSFLERRIDQMTRATTKWRGPKAALAGAVALAAVAVACESPTPTADEADVDRESAPTSISEDVASAESTDELPPPSKGGEASDRPSFIPYDVAPKLQNPREVQQALERFYPRNLKNQGIGGRVVLWVFVDEQGEVSQARVQEGSGYAALDEAARKVAAQMEFSPAQNRDETTAVWVQQPITFEVLTE